MMMNQVVMEKSDRDGKDEEDDDPDEENKGEKDDYDMPDETDKDDPDGYRKYGKDDEGISDQEGGKVWVRGIKHKLYSKHKNLESNGRLVEWETFYVGFQQCTHLMCCKTKNGWEWSGNNSVECPAYKLHVYEMVEKSFKVQLLD